ncbi:hypothetical protein KO492_14080 [Celeribacter halophilus]|nr:hypothetical protein [Celeribacter halophilus]
METLKGSVLLIGYGEVGRAFGAQVEQSGSRPIYVDPMARNIPDTATVLNTLPAEIPDTTLVLGAFPSAAARSVAQDLATRSGAFLYVDMSSSPQGLMQDCAAEFGNQSARFVDAAIVGSVDLSGAKAPILLSGPNADQAEAALRALGFDAKALPDSKAGDACGVKLLRTLMTKGIEALAIECFSAAAKMGLSKEICENLSDIGVRPFPELLDAMVRSHVIHAPRRKLEMEAAIDQAQSLGLQVPVNQSVLEVYKATSARIEAEHPNVPMSIGQALNWLSKP